MIRNKYLYLTVVLVILDQLTKYFFERFNDFSLYIFDLRLGISYNSNYGTWLISENNIVLMTLVTFGSIILLILLLQYGRFYNSLFSDKVFMNLFISFLSALIIGNILMDHFILGYIRDFIVTPIAITNFADIYGWLSILFLLLEIILNRKIIRYKKSYSLKGYMSFLLKK